MNLSVPQPQINSLSNWFKGEKYRERPSIALAGMVFIVPGLPIPECQSTVRLLAHHLQYRLHHPLAGDAVHAAEIYRALAAETG